MPDTLRVVVAAADPAPIVEALRAYGGDGVEIVVELDVATRPAPALICFGADRLDAVASTVQRFGDAPPPFAVFAPARDDGALEIALGLGARDYLSSDDPARLKPATAALVTRARVEAAAREHTWLVEQIVDALPFVIFAKRAADLRMAYVNKTLTEFFHGPKEAFVGKTDHDHFPKEQADEVVALDRELLASKQPRAFEETRRANGVDLVWSTRKVPILDESGAARYLVGITEEVTEKKRALEDLKKSRAVSARSLASYQQRALQMEIIRQQNEDLDRLASDLAKAKQLEEARAREIEQAARLKSEFLANFSHEIRTPLNGIHGYCDLLLREEGSRLTPHGRRDLNVIKANAKTLLALINDILDLSKIEAGHVDVVRAELDVRAIVEECTATVREYLQGKSVIISAHVDPDAAAVTTDGLKLKQILLNLLSNAAKFTETGEIVLDVKADGKTAVFRVEDTGVGIPADQVPFIFDKFRQVDGSPTRRVGGTGLGLAIVRELTRILGGTVEVSSVLGRGSVFTVRLEGAVKPTDPATRPATITRPDTQVATLESTFLVVDDDPLVHQLLCAELEKEGFTVMLALDGVEALSVARARPPKAIVLDLLLPKVSGWSVLTEIKSDPALSAIPVVIISVEEQRARGFSLGAVEYLVKPFEAEQLVALVGRLTSAAPGEVLVVDDDASMRELVGRHLKRAGFSFAEARTGEEALLRARISKPSLVILDLVMPGLDGFEVLRRLRADDVSVPILVLTGKTLTGAEEAALRDGMAAVLHKGGLAIDSVVAEARRLLVQKRNEAAQQLARILYVEDSTQNRDVVRRYLRGEFDVIEAEDGEHGLDRAQRDRPQLILMDLSLPKLDGWEATRRLKAGPLASIPVIALTAHASREDQARARAAGCDGYLTKPVDRELLIATIRQHLAARKTPTPR